MLQSQIRLLEEAKHLIDQFLEIYPQLVAQAQEVAATAEVAPAATKELPFEYEVSTLLQKFGMPLHVKGFEYNKMAIKLVTEDRTMLSAVTKELYPTIAENYSTTPSRVERAIRHAIELMDEKCNKFYTDNFDDQPTNSAFIAWCVEYLKFNK